MNTAPLALTAVLLSIGAPLASAQTSTSRANASAQATSCSKCTHAPCRCGFSPSYYTRHRKPARPAPPRHYPVSLHWTRVHSAPALTTTNVTARRARTVPAPVPSTRYGYVSGGRSGFAFDTRRTRYYGRHSRIGTTTIVPTPRRPASVPSRVPRVSLGYVPSRSWTRGGFGGRGNFSTRHCR